MCPAEFSCPTKTRARLFVCWTSFPPEFCVMGVLPLAVWSALAWMVVRPALHILLYCDFLPDGFY